jgi:hypothetical protein
MGSITVCSERLKYRRVLFTLRVMVTSLTFLGMIYIAVGGLKQWQSVVVLRRLNSSPPFSNAIFTCPLCLIVDRDKQIE